MMKRIMVIGVSAGAGKSTLARTIGEVLDISVFHLDRFYWRAGWIEAPFEEFQQAQAELVEQEEWIIEGNYTGTLSIRAERADTIVYIEIPIHKCLYRVVKRWLMNIGRTRSDMADGCAEKLDWKFIKFIVTTYYQRKKAMAVRLEVLKEEGKKVYILSNNKEINQFLREIAK